MYSILQLHSKPSHHLSLFQYLLSSQTQNVTPEFPVDVPTSTKTKQASPPVVSNSEESAPSVSLRIRLHRSRRNIDLTPLNQQIGRQARFARHRRVGMGIAYLSLCALLASIHIAPYPKTAEEQIEKQKDGNSPNSRILNLSI